MKPGFLLFLMGLLFVSCEHRELAEPIDRRYVRVYLDENIRNVHYGFYDESKPTPTYKSPNVMRVALCDPITNRVVTETYLRNKGQDQRGTYLDGHITADAGTYHLIAYNFDTESTHIRFGDDYQRMEVYTNPIAEELKSMLVSTRNENEFQLPNWDILYEPDHFLVESEQEVEIGYETDSLMASHGEYLVANSVVKTYYLQINIKGAEYVKSAVALLTGMAGSVQLCNRTMVTNNPSSLYFTMQTDAPELRTDIAHAFASFNTFGKLENQEGYLLLTFEFLTIYGETQVETIRLTDLFDKAEVKNNQWIILDELIEIKSGPAEGGGMSPDVNDWNQEEGYITI